METERAWMETERPCMEIERAWMETERARMESDRAWMETVDTASLARLGLGASSPPRGALGRFSAFSTH